MTKRLFVLIVLLLAACVPQVKTTNKEISGGYIADHPEDFGVVALVYQYTMNTRCSGVVIAPRVILTAAHCVSSDELGPFVQWEPWKLKVVEKTNYIPEYKEENVKEVETIIMRGDFPVYWPYSDFDDLGVGIMNDIALVITKTRLKTRPMDILHTRGPPLEEGVPLLLAGYGYILTTHTIRQRFTLGNSNLEYTTTHEFWAYNTPASPCGGDGGGPAFVKVNEKWVVAGIISRSGYDRMCTEGAIYTMVPAYSGWIEDNTEEFEDEEHGCSTGGSSGLPIILLVALMLLWRRDDC